MRTKDYDKMQRIKEALVRIILRDGIENTSVAKIAKEAGVSPATIYIYYDSKEAMLSEVYQECARQSYGYLMGRIRPEMDARELIDALVRGYYSFSVDHAEIFGFVEQCMHSPGLAGIFREEDLSAQILDMIHPYQDRGVMKRCSNENLNAMLFAPVRFLSMNRTSPAEKNTVMLNELISMLQDLLLM